MSNISANTCCAAELLMALASTRPTSSSKASGWNFKLASVSNFTSAESTPIAAWLVASLTFASVSLAKRLLMIQLATAFGFFVCLAMFSK